MDGAGSFLKSIRAVERGRATATEAREVECLARLAGHRRHMGMARRILKRHRPIRWAVAGLVPLLAILVIAL